MDSKITPQECINGDVQISNVNATGAGRKNARQLFWVASIFIATVLLCAPSFRLVQSFGLFDEGIILHAADRMLRGDRLYIDFFEVLPPGSFVLVEGWFSALGPSVLSARLLAILTIATIAAFTFAACYEACRSVPISSLLTFQWVLLSQGELTIVSHHWFTTMFAMIAAWAALSSFRRSTSSFAGAVVAGLAAGAATMTVLNRGALVLLACVFVFAGGQDRKGKLVALLAGAAIAPLFILVYIIIHSSIYSSFDHIILFPASHYLNVNRLPFGYGWGWSTLPLLMLFPVVAIFLALTCVSQGRTVVRDPLLQSCVAFGVASFVGCYPRPDIPHIGFSAPLALPLLAFSLNATIAKWRMIGRVPLVALSIVLCLPAMLLVVLRADKAWSGPSFATPRGAVKLASLPPGGARLIERIAATSPEDRYFFYPYLPMLPFLTDRAQMSALDLFTPGYTTPAQYEEACVFATRFAKWFIIDVNWNGPELLRWTFPNIPDPTPPERKAAERALLQNFELVAIEGTFEMRRRSPAADEEACRHPD